MYRPYYYRYPVHPPVPPVSQPAYYRPPPVNQLPQQYPIDWMSPHGRMPPAHPFNPPIQYGMDQGGPMASPQQQVAKPPSWLEVFKTEKGNVDVNKVMSTAGQMMSTAQQFGSIVKGIGSIFPKG